jgi:hypothetical protein
MDNNSTTVYGNSTDRGLSTAIYIMVSGRIPTEFTDSFDSLRLLQSQEEHQLDRMQETLSSVVSPTNSLTDQRDNVRSAGSTGKMIELVN